MKTESSNGAASGDPYTSAQGPEGLSSPEFVLLNSSGIHVLERDTPPFKDTPPDPRTQSPHSRRWNQPTVLQGSLLLPPPPPPWGQILYKHYRQTVNQADARIFTPPDDGAMWETSGGVNHLHSAPPGISGLITGRQRFGAEAGKHHPSAELSLCKMCKCLQLGGRGGEGTI